MASWRYKPFAIHLLCASSAILFFLSPALAQEQFHSPGWVVISVEEYRSLRARAFPSGSEMEAPPVDATLTRVDYDLQINSEIAFGRANLTVDVLKEGWVRVPIPPGLLVRQARLEGRPLSLVPASAHKGADGQLAALLSRAGRAVLQLEIALPILSSTGNESISLPATASGVTRASVQLPRQGVDVRVGEAEHGRADAAIAHVKEDVAVQIDDLGPLGRAIIDRPLPRQEHFRPLGQQLGAAGNDFTRPTIESLASF